MARSSLTVERVREILDYNPETGIFIRNVRLAQRHHAGDRADFLITKGNNVGYMRVSFDSMRFLAHQLAWFYVHGEWPEEHVDHINHDTADNRLCNLRSATNSLNQQNKLKAMKNNVSGYLGVVPVNGKFGAQIIKDRKKTWLGTFDCPRAAHQAYLEAKRKLHPGCTI